MGGDAPTQGSGADARAHNPTASLRPVDVPGEQDTRRATSTATERHALQGERATDACRRADPISPGSLSRGRGEREGSSRIDPSTDRANGSTPAAVTSELAETPGSLSHPREGDGASRGRTRQTARSQSCPPGDANSPNPIRRRQRIWYGYAGPRERQ
jgi:hypothetical protein